MILPEQPQRVNVDAILHHCFLEGLVPASYCGMHILFTRHRILHVQLFIDRYMEKNTTVSQNGLFHRGVYPVVQTMTRIARTIERRMDDIGEDLSVYLVFVMATNVSWK